MKTYADAYERIAKREGAYQKRLADAEKAGDTFARNSATQMLSRIQMLKDELFAEQEASKPPVAGEQFAYGGNPPYTDILPMRPTYLNTNYIQDNVGKRYRTKQLLQRKPEVYTIPSGLGAYTADIDPADTFSFAPIASLTGTVPKAVPTGLSMMAGSPYKNVSATKSKDWKPLSTNFGKRTIDKVAVPASQKPSWGAKALAAMSDKASGIANTLGTVLPYAAQFLPELIGLNQVNKMEAPTDMSQLDAPLIDTTVDTSASRAAIQNATRQGTASADGLRSSAAARALGAATYLNGADSLADIEMQSANQARTLRNQQAGMLSDTRNKNLEIAYQNANRQSEFRNAQRDARMGLVNSMGDKALSMLSEQRMLQAQRQQAALYAKMFDSEMLKRNGLDVLGLGTPGITGYDTYGTFGRMPLATTSNRRR